METQTTKNTTLLILGNGAHNIYRYTHKQLDSLFDILILDKDGEPDELSVLDSIRTPGVLLLCCLGGGHTRQIPDIVPRLQAAGKHLSSVCILPFNFEGDKHATLAMDTIRYLSEQGIPGKLFRNDAICELFPDDNMIETFTKAHHIIAGNILETAGIQKDDSTINN